MYGRIWMPRCILLGLMVFLAGPARCAGQNTSSTPGDYAITQVGPHSQVWANAAGQSVTKIQTGMNFWNGSQWVPCVNSFAISADGASFVANEIQEPIVLAANLNVVVAVQVTTPVPDSLNLSSTPVAIGLFDSASGKSVIIATLTNTTGVLVDPEDVVYPNAIIGSTLSASVVYSLPDTGSFHQDVVFTGFDPGFDPTVWGFAADSTNTLQIQIFTEFYSLPQPVTATPTVISSVQDPALRANMASPDLTDVTYDFGNFVFGPGQAYVAAPNASPSGGVQIAKEFVSSLGKTYLVETIPLPQILNELLALPPVQVSSLNKPATATKTRIAAASLPSLRDAKKSPIEKIAAANSPPVLGRPHGLVADYVVTVSSPSSRPFTVQTPRILSADQCS